MEDLHLPASKLSVVAFMVVITLAALRAYRYPEYSSDGFQYMANAVAMHGADARQIHDAVYREIYAGIPNNIQDHLLGKDTVETSQSISFRERAANAERFAEFLPCFAVRPIFNELVYIFHYWFGIGLLRAVVLITVLSYWVMGWVALLWITKYSGAAVAAVLTSILVVTPPVWELARSTTPDALSALVLLGGLYLILETDRIAVGVALLLISIYVRTDNVLIALLALAYLTWKRKIDLLKAAVLAIVAVVSVPLINHFAGDYGPAMLYYRVFVAIPIAPGEMTVHFGFHDYLVALRTGMASAIHESFIPFVLMGAIGLVRRASAAIVALTLLAMAFGVAHLVLYPDPEERFFGLFFVAMGISVASALFQRTPSSVEQSSQLPWRELVTR